MLRKQNINIIFESDSNRVANEIINCDGDIQIQGIYKDKNNTTSVNLLNPNEHDLQNMIHETRDITHEPTDAIPIVKKEIPMYENTLPTHRKIYDIASMEVYEVHLKMQSKPRLKVK